MSGGGAPCGACKFLRRKCVKGCVFAPYFGSEQGATHFAAVHKIFGASNVSKLLLHIPTPERCEAVITISYEAQARIKDPVYGCVSHIFALQQQVASLQAELASVQAQLASRVAAESATPTSVSSPVMTGHHPRHHQFSGSAVPCQPTLQVNNGTVHRVKEESPVTFGNWMDYEIFHDSCREMEALHRSSCSQEFMGNDGGELQAVAHALLRRN
ncbi:hypothetical protein SUGI_0858710 [Cryptomeria japonica]|uniref:LOB domain-containing protein 29 n=1 Tax=Cryptomeria japonica TaxID=3369 RepID=UPI00241475CB|nr:LOB domain-containing protein 29 [Cryptomeria japonica]GLJ41491.1 hypothetical protein SUGI_0858710 [Cryptomeria japonica]